MTGYAPIPLNRSIVVYKPKGRPSTFNWSTAMAFCEHIAEGGTIRAFCEKPGNPSWPTIQRWLRSKDAFRAQYAHAKDDKAHVLADECLEIADDARNDWMERQLDNGQTIEVFNHEHVQRSRLRIDTRKWAAGKLAPKVYGEKYVSPEDGGNIFVQCWQAISGNKALTHG